MCDDYKWDNYLPETKGRGYTQLHLYLGQSEGKRYPPKMPTIYQYRMSEDIL